MQDLKTPIHGLREFFGDKLLGGWIGSDEPRQ